MLKKISQWKKTYWPATVAGQYVFFIGIYFYRNKKNIPIKQNIVQLNHLGAWSSAGQPSWVCSSLAGEWNGHDDDDNIQDEENDDYGGNIDNNDDNNTDDDHDDSDGNDTIDDDKDTDDDSESLVTLQGQLAAATSLQPPRES